jgi:4-methoxybenzoate monooxygenase (O-demethylating)
MHSHPRSVLSRIISPVAMRALRDDWADKAERIIDTLLAKQSFDAVPDLAVAFPLEVFPDAVGFQKDGRDNLLPFGNMIFNSFMQNNDRFRESVKEAEPVISWIFQQCQRKNLSPSGFGSQIWQACDDGVVTEEQAPILIRTFLQAGMDTTVAALGNAIYAFAKFPDQWSALRADASLIRASFDEVLRWETPVQTFFRTTTQGVDVDGSHIEEGRKVLLMMAAANRDPCRFEEPQQFNIRRRTTGHVGFGTGVHGCVGQAIARLEGELIFAALARRIERIELDGSPVRKLNNTLRSFSSIPVRIIPA